MRKFLTLLILTFLVSAASAVTIVDPTVNFGAYAGFANPGVIKASDIYATDDLKVGDDGEFGGDVTIVGALAVGSGTVNSGVYDGDWRLAANHSFYSTAGSGGIDWSNGTGAWKMPTGQGTIAGATDFNGAITCRNVTLDANYNVVTSGTGAITSANTVTGEHLYSTDDAYIKDHMEVDGWARVAGNLTANSLVSNGTLALSADKITGLAQGTAGTDAVNKDQLNGMLNKTGDPAAFTTIRASSNIVASSTAKFGGRVTGQDLTVNNTTNLKQPIYFDVYPTVTSNTSISDSSIYSTFLINGGLTKGINMTLPSAASAIGMTLTFVAITDPGSNTLIIGGDGAETINGAASQTSSAQWDAITVYSNGSAWYVVSKIGSWS